MSSVWTLLHVCHLGLIFSVLAFVNQLKLIKQSYFCSVNLE